MSRIITFYSYKGGTGRSMALANTAWILASQGNRVLTIDWDLEAPGLHRYFHPFLADKELHGQESQGVIDMAMDFATRAATPSTHGGQRDSQWYLEFADFSKWRQKLRWPSGNPVRLGRDGRGEIDFVPAGRQTPEYANRVNRFDWHNFYETLGGGLFFDAARKRLGDYDYVLIDSRTGVSDTSGICTVQMPDTVVVCFTLNHQSIKGAFAVAQSVRERRSDIRILPLPTRVDGSEEKLLNRMKNYAADLFTPLLDKEIGVSEYWFKMEVPYVPRYAYAERLSMFEEQASISASTLPAMERLTDYLTDGIVRSAQQLPSEERLAALECFEGIDDTTVARPVEPVAINESAVPSHDTRSQGPPVDDWSSPNPPAVRSIQDYLRPYWEELLGSPWAVGVALGTLTLTEMQGWMLQMYPFIHTFPKFLAEALIKVDDDYSRSFLIDSMRVEKSHAEHWLWMGTGFGVPRERMLALAEGRHPMLHDVQSLHDCLWYVNTRGSLPEAVAATSFAITGMLRDIARKVTGGFEHYKGVPGVDLSNKTYRWMREHARYDDDRPRIAMEIIERYATSARSQMRVALAMKRSVELLNRSLTASYQAYSGLSSIDQAEGLREESLDRVTLGELLGEARIVLHSSAGK